MKKWIVVLAVTGAFLAWVFVTSVDPASADSNPAKKNQWQYQCFTASGVTQVTERANKMGEQGWELVTSAGGAETLWCFKRPLWKK